MKKAKKTRTPASSKARSTRTRKETASDDSVELTSQFEGEPCQLDLEADKESAKISPKKEAPLDSELTLSLSTSLVDKLRKTATEEGVDIDSLAGELLAEGVVLRAWEIIERKNTMRSGPQSGQSNANNNNRHGNNRRGRHNNRRTANANNWMEDKAAFLEYVRNQEKRRR